jgi:hypothetical protein
MEIRKMLARKDVKLMTLLLSSLLIASASAAMYYSLTASSTIEVYASYVVFYVGSDNATKGLVVKFNSVNTTATLTGLRAYPNATFTYTDPVRVRNKGALTAQLRLSPDVNPSTNPEDFEYVKFLLNATNSGDRKWLNYTSNGVSWTSPSGSTTWTTTGITGSSSWPIVIYTKANANGVASEQVTISIKVDVDYPD